jgi:hypothetical protein
VKRHTGHRRGLGSGRRPDVFLGGPLRSLADRKYLESIAATVSDLGFSVWLPHRDVGVLRRSGDDLAPLQQNLDVLREVDYAIFTLDSERTGTGIELGYLCALRDARRSSATLIGMMRHGSSPSDLMARFCLEKYGVCIAGVEELRELLSRLATPRK